MREAQSITRTTFRDHTSSELLLLFPESSVGARMERNFVDSRLLSRIAHLQDAIHQPAIKTSKDQTSCSPRLRSARPACHSIAYWAQPRPRQRAIPQRNPYAG